MWIDIDHIDLAVRIIVGNQQPEAGLLVVVSGWKFPVMNGQPSSGTIAHCLPGQAQAIEVAFIGCRHSEILPTTEGFDSLCRIFRHRGKALDVVRMKMDHFVRLNQFRLMMTSMLVQLELSWRLPDQSQNLCARYFGPIDRDFLFVDPNDVALRPWKRFFFEGEDLYLDDFEEFFSCSVLVQEVSPPWTLADTIP